MRRIQQIQLNPLSVLDQKEIKAAITKLRSNKSYADKPTLYHDALMIGIKRLSTETGS